VHFFHIVPPAGFLFRFAQNFVQTGLTQVFHNNVATSNSIEVVFDVIRSAVCTIKEALFLLEIIGTDGTAPGNETRCDVYIAL